VLREIKKAIFICAEKAVFIRKDRHTEILMSIPAYRFHDIR
jgi:hypothetical protein